MADAAKYWEETVAEGGVAPDAQKDFVHPEDVIDEQKLVADQKAAEDSANDLNYIVNKPRGRRWLYQLIWGIGHYSELSASLEKEDTVFREGQRSVAIAVHEEVRRLRPDMYMKMLEENHLNG
jgi:hypothetical protein